MAQGNPQDDFVQLATEGSGKKMDNAVVTRDDGTVVYRERISIASDDNSRIQVEVRGESGQAALRVNGEVVELLNEMNHTLKMILTLLIMQTGEDMDQLAEVVALNE